MLIFIQLGMKILSYTELKSHPNKFLEDHLKNVANFSKSSLNSLKFENTDVLSEVSYLIGLSHDFAKSTSFFQDYLVNNHKNENTPHSFLSAVFSYFVIDDYLNRENISFDNNLAIISYIAVLHHHGNIKNISILDEYHDKKVESKIIKKQLNDLINSDDNLKLFYEDENINLEYFFENFDEISEKISDDLYSFEYDNNLDNYFLILLLYSVLIDADKMDASESPLIKRNPIPDDMVDKYKSNNSFDLKGINEIREEAYLEVEGKIENIDLSEKIYSINLPTGIGKTLTGFSAVLKLRNKIHDELGFYPRIIYSLPFLSVIDQNEEIIREIFSENNLNGSNYLLKHNHLAEMEYFEGDDEYDISNSKILIEGWNSEVIITTFIQLFYSLIGNKNSFLRKFHNITNSIIILDEIQSIPHKYWGIINFILKKLAYEFNCWIILMTATQPLIFKENEIISLVDNVDYYFNQFNRLNFNFQLDNINLEEFGDNLIHEITTTDKDFLVVLNTIDSSKKLYEYLKQYYVNEIGDVSIDDDGICHINENINLIYLSTNLIPSKRLKKINFIKNSENQNIVISTQLIEAGVDIDVDIVYRDFAPLDSIIQTAGRCNRSGKKDKGLVNVISLVDDNGKQYSGYVYQDLLLTTTREILNQYDFISEKEFNLSASKNYFNLISQRSFDDDELKDILKYLKFDEIPSKFKLIENLPNKIDVFVCADNEAEKLLDQYIFIVENLSGFKRKEEFLKIKSKFYQYVISVDEKKFGSCNLLYDEIGVIYSHDLERKYSSDLGFISGDDEEPMIW